MLNLTTPARGDRARAALDKVRAAIEKLRAERDTLNDAPLPLSETIERLMTVVRDYASRSENRLTSFALLGGPMDFTQPRCHLDNLALKWNTAPDALGNL
jgi:hypothetical protein